MLPCTFPIYLSSMKFIYFYLADLYIGDLFYSLTPLYINFIVISSFTLFCKCSTSNYINTPLNISTIFIYTLRYLRKNKLPLPSGSHVLILLQAFFVRPALLYPNHIHKSQLFLLEFSPFVASFLLIHSVLLLYFLYLFHSTNHLILYTY